MKLQIDPYVLKLGYGCNNNCKFCFQEKRSPFFKTRSLVKNELDQAKFNGFRYIVFEGGEPTLSNDIISLIRYAKMIGLKKIDIQSNGRMFYYKKICKNFIDVGVNSFSCSLQSNKNNIHDFLTSTPGSFKETVKGIKNLKSLRQTVANQTVVTKVNYRVLKDTVKYLIRLKVDRLQLNFIQPVGVAKENFKLLVPNISEVVIYVKRALEAGIKANTYIGTMGIPCCLLGDYFNYAQEYRRAKAGGNPNHVPFKHKDKQCKKCWFFNNCEGPWSSYSKIFGWNEFKPKLNKS